MKNKILIAVILFSALFITLAIMYKNSDCYCFKVDINLDDTLAHKIDSVIASEIKDNLSQIEELKEVMIFSRANNCSVYCKIYPFVFNKTQISNRLEKKINETMLDVDKNARVSFDDNFCTKYQTFLVVSTDKVDYKVLKKYCDIVLDELLGLNLSSKIINIGEQHRAAYIYFKNSDLVKYDVDLGEIKEILSKNNLLQSSSIKTNSSNSYNVYTNGSINSIKDIEDIAMYYKNKNFSIKFKDIFKIKEKTREPYSPLAYYDNQKAIVFAISKRKFYPEIIFNLRINHLINKLEKEFPCYIKFNSIQLSSIKPIEIYFKNRTSIYNTKNEYEKIYSKLKENSIDNVLFLIGTDMPRVSNNNIFFENEKNKLVILSKNNTGRIKNILKEKGIDYLNKTDKKIAFENYNLNELYRTLEEYKEEHPDAVIPYTDKTAQINYEINNFNLNDFRSEKQEIINTIKAAYNGLEAGYYYDKNVKIPIILQNEDDLERLYYYSKHYKTLIYIGTNSKTSLSEGFSKIVRRNEKYKAKLIFKQ